MNIKKTLIVAAACVAMAVSASANTVALWDYQGTSGIATASPTMGSGSTDLFGGPIYAGTGTPSWAVAGTTQTDSAGKDGNAPTGKNEAFGTKDYYTSGVAGNRGIYWVTSTAGYQLSSISWDWYASATGPKDWTLQYTSNYLGPNTTDSTWITVGSASVAASSTWATNSMSLSGPTFASASDDANFAFRLVNSDTTSVNNGTIASTGTFRVDMVTVSGTPVAVPEPGSMVALLSGLIGLVGLVGKSKRH